MNKKRNITTEDCRIIFLEHDLQLDKNEEYKTLSSNLKAYNSDGYKVYTSLDSVEQGKIPKIISAKNPYTIENIKLWLIRNAPNIELLSKEYVGSGINLIFVLKNSNLPPFERNWSNFRRNQEHPIISLINKNNDRMHSSEFVRENITKHLEKYNPKWELVKGEEFNYKGVHHRLKLIHELGYKAEYDYSTLCHGTRHLKLRLFNIYKPDISIFNVKLWLELNSKMRIKHGQKYIGVDKHYIFICEKHGEQRILLENILCIHGWRKSSIVESKFNNRR